jgi:hypothetical protein
VLSAGREFVQRRRENYAPRDDALAVTARPNGPGTEGKRPNWSLALPIDLGELESVPSAVDLA